MVGIIELGWNELIEHDSDGDDEFSSTQSIYRLCTIYLLPSQWDGVAYLCCVTLLAVKKKTPLFIVSYSFIIWKALKQRILK